MNKFYKKFLGMGLSLLFLMPSPIMANAENSQEVNINSLQKSNVENSQEININNSQKPNVENSQEINIDNSQKTNALYQKGIAFGAIDPSEVSLENWQEQEKNYRENYDTAIKEGILKDISYDKWLERNNYGQFPKMDPEIFDEIVIPPDPQTNSRRKKRSVKPYIQSGDILITNATSSFGILGHAAIANGNEYILDMPGGRNGRPYNDNNRQSTASAWFNDYRNGWIRVFRIKNRSLAKQVGRYADRHYYSTNGSATKNVHIDYDMNADLYDMRKAYCSKLVYCAYWYGSGSLPVMRKKSGFIDPYGLLPCFTPAYAPGRVN
ncbi:hypothetical protein UMC2PCS14_00081 (plasmid) [[Clostridium] sordellii]|uniref:hypothetical protein n=1 Tax=Paraclostridium sordellii TaxID=1505 RepID=UPI0005408A9B|nr:hypothetical protein [Paeniclostridium sordellii]CEK36584.1 hypothetical protein UMC2PCS14_00081 (plasmid) [[Clostridium] sordellii] [Paeniclostridium sordellii]